MSTSEQYRSIFHPAHVVGVFRGWDEIEKINLISLEKAIE